MLPNKASKTVGEAAAMQDGIALSAARNKLIAEDGWIFRETPGQPVECLRRQGDEALAPAQVTQGPYPSE